jgi:hypothetical protein
MLRKISEERRPFYEFCWSHWSKYIYCLVFKLSPCFNCNIFLFGQFPGVWVLIADVSELLIGSIFIGRWMKMKMEPIRSSETSAIKTQTPGNYPKRNILQLKNGESLKTRLFILFSVLRLVHSLFRSEFSRDSDLVLLSSCNFQYHLFSLRSLH